MSLNSATPALTLPYLMPAQAQKHVTVNDSLTRLDALVQMRLLGINHLTPPALPEAGALYGIGTGASGAFAGQDGQIARWADNSWQFIAPQDGLLAVDLTAGQLLIWQGSQWQTPALTQLARLGIGTLADDTNRLALAAPASLFSHAGSDHRMVLNKAAVSDTATVMFQSGWSGRAEMGLAGTDHWGLKLSPDGSSWSEVICADPATGHVALGGHTNSPSCSLDAAGALRCGQTTSASRPNAATVGVGAMIYDTDLSQPLWSDGALWRDAMGSAV